MHTETDPEAALELFTRDPARFDLVITDQAMPRMSGVTLARRVLAVRPEIPILLCTGYSATVDEDIARTEGIKGFLMKPLTREQMAVMVKKTLAKGGRRTTETTDDGREDRWTMRTDGRWTTGRSAP